MMNQYNNPDYCFCNQPGGDCEDMTFEEWEAYNECYQDQNCHEIFCIEIDDQINRPDFQLRADSLKNNYGLQYETGYFEDLNGNFTSGDATNNGSGGHSLSYDGLNPANMFGYMHTHIDDYTKPDGTIVMPIKMQSPKDVLFFLQLILTHSVTGTELHKVYGSMSSSTGNYTIKFSGDVNDIAANLATLGAQEKKLKRKFRKHFRNKKPNLYEKTFLKFLYDYIGIDGIDLFKINDNGTIEQKELNPNGEVISTPC